MKKSKEANIERLRTPMLMTGALVVGSLVLASFSYTNNTLRDIKTASHESAVEIEFMEEIVVTSQKIEMPKIDPAVLPPSPDPIHIDSNKITPPDPTPFILPPNFGEDTAAVIIIPDPVVEFPDVDAQFPGGAAAMQQWISENVVYPQEAIEIGDEGKVYLSFIVEPDGSLSNVQVIRSVSGSLDKEALRVTNKMPKWSPGEAQGKRVRTRCRLPIVFELAD